MTHALNIAIVGYGVAGTTTAVLVRRLVHRVEHFDHIDEVRRAGAGILLHPPALSILDELGLSTAALKRGSRVNQLKAETLSGRRIMNIDYGAHARDTFALGIQRSALLQLLRSADAAADQVVRGRSVVSVDADCGSLLLDDGTEYGPYDLIVAADGANSAVRRCFPALVARDRLYRSAALVWLVNDPAELADPSVSQYFNGTRHVSVWPVGSSAPGSPIRANFSMNVPLSEACGFLESGEWLEVAARLCPKLSPLLMANQNDRTGPFLYTYRDVVLRRYTVGRVVFVGDAAHSMSPQLGQGVRLALQGASALAHALQSCEELQVALRRYDAQQSAQVRPLQRACRWLTPMFQSNSRILAALRDTASGPVTRIRGVEKRLHGLVAAA